MYCHDHHRVDSRLAGIFRPLMAATMQPLCHCKKITIALVLRLFGIQSNEPIHNAVPPSGSVCTRLIAESIGLIHSWTAKARSICACAAWGTRLYEEGISPRFS